MGKGVIKGEGGGGSDGGVNEGGSIGGGVYMCGAGLRMGGDSGVRMRDFLGGGNPEWVLG